MIGQVDTVHAWRFFIFKANGFFTEKGNYKSWIIVRQRYKLHRNKQKAKLKMDEYCTEFIKVVMFCNQLMLYNVRDFLQKANFVFGLCYGPFLLFQSFR